MTTASRVVSIRIAVEGGDDIRRQFEQIGTEGQAQLQRVGAVDLSSVRQQFEAIGTAAGDSAAAAAVSIGTLNVQIAETGRAAGTAMDETGRASDTLSGRLASMGARAQDAADAVKSFVAAGQSLNEVLRLSYVVRTAEDALVSVGQAAAGTASEIDKVVERAVVLRLALSGLRSAGLAIPGVQELVLAGIAVGKVAGVVGDAIAANDAYIASHQSLQATLVRTNSASGLTATAMEDAAARQAQAGRTTAAAMTAVAEQVVKVRTVTAENLPAVLALSEDLVVKLDKDLPSAAGTLTGWMEQGTRAFADMEAAGIRVGYAVEKQAKGFEDAGNRAAVTTAILDAVQRSVGGTAARMDEGAASVHRFELAWESLITGVGQKLGPFVAMVRDAWTWLTAPLDFPRDLGSMFMENLTDALGTRPLAQQLDRDKALLAKAIAERDQLIEQGGESAFLALQNVENRIAVLERRVEKGRAGLKTMGIDPDQVAADGRKLSVTIDENARKLDEWGKTLDSGLKATIKPELTDQIKAINAEFTKTKAALEALRLPDGSNGAAVDARIADARRLADAQIKSAREAYGEVGVALADYLVKLDGERAAVLMSDRERAVMTALIQAEAAARQDGIDLTRDQRAEIEAEAGAIYDLTKAKALVNQLVAQGKTEQQKYAETVRDATRALSLMQAAGQVTAEDLAAFTRALQEQGPAFKEAQRAAEEYGRETSRTARQVAGDWSRAIFDGMTGKGKEQDILGWFRTLFQRVAVAAIEANVTLPITTHLVNAVPGLFGISSASGAVAGAGAGQAGAGSGMLGSAGQFLQLGNNAYNIYSGGNMLGSAANWFATSSAGQSLGLSTTGFIDTIGAEQIINTTPILTQSGSSFTGVASGIGAAAPYGFIGGLGGALVANNFMNGSRAGAGVTGAALGVGSMAAGTAMAGGTAALAAVPVYGWIAAAVIAAVTAIMGANGKAPTPYGGAWVETDSTGQVFRRAQGAENGVNADDLAKRADAINSVMAGIAMAGGYAYDQITLATEYQAGKNGKGNRTLIGGWGGELVSTSDDPARIALDALKALRDSGRMTGGDPLSDRVLGKAIENGGADTIEDMVKAIGLAKQISESTTALSEFDKSLQGFTVRAKSAQADALKPMRDELALATKFDIQPEYIRLVTQQLTGMLDDLAHPREWTAAEVAVAELNGQLAALREAAENVSPALASTVDAVQSAAMARLRNNWEKTLSATEAEAAGRSYITQIQGLADTMATELRNAAALGGDAEKVSQTYNRLMANVIDGLSASQLRDVIATFGDLGGAVARLADLSRQAAAELTVRALTVLGDASGAGLMGLRQQQQKELEGYWGTGQYDYAVLVQQAEYSARALDLAKADLAEALTRQEQAITDNTAAARDLAQSNKAFLASVTAAANDNLTNTQISPLSSWEMLVEARDQRDAAFTAALGGDADARNRIIGLISRTDELARGYFASTDRGDFDRGQDMLAQLGVAAGEQLDTAERAVRIADDQLTELRRQREALTRLGERPLPGIDTLTAAVQDAFAAQQAALSALATLPDVLAARTGGTGGGISATAAFEQARSLRDARWDELSHLGLSTGDIFADPRFQTLTALQADAIGKITDTAYLYRQLEAATGPVIAQQLRDRLGQLLGQDVPQFAAGGFLPSGLGLAGETGRPELIFGPAYVANPDVTARMMDRLSGRPANDRWGGDTIAEYRRPSSASVDGSGEMVRVLNRLCDKVDALIRVVAAGGDGTLDGLAEVADGVRAVVKVAANGGVRS